MKMRGAAVPLGCGGICRLECAECLSWLCAWRGSEDHANTWRYEHYVLDVGVMTMQTRAVRFAHCFSNEDSYDCECSRNHTMSRSQIYLQRLLPK